MSELAVRVVLKADGSGLVGQLKLSGEELSRFKAEASGAGADARQLGAGAQVAATGTAALGAEAAKTSASVEEVGRSAGSAQAAVLSLSTVEEKLDAILQQLIVTTRSAVVANDQLDDGMRDTATAARIAETAVAALGQTEKIAETQATELGNELTHVAAAAKAAAVAQDAAATAVGKSTRAARESEQAAARQAFAVRNVGQQFGDFGLSVAGGISPARAFGQQAGQLGYALSEMGGRLGKVGAFLVGPWGIALTIAAAVLAPLVEKLFEGGKAAEEFEKKATAAAASADTFGTTQSTLGKIIDLTTGKLKTQNVVLIQSIRLQAQAALVAAQAKEKEDAKALRGVSRSGFVESLTNSLRDIGSSFGTNFQSTGQAAATRAQTEALAPLKAVVDGFIASKAPLNDAVETAISGIERLGTTGKLAGRDILAVKAALLALATDRSDQQAQQALIDAVDGKGLDPRLKPYEKPKKPQAPKSTAARDEFGRDAADKIASITEGFTDTPTQIAKVDKALRELDDLIDDIARKKPPGFEKLIADALKAKAIVRDGINKPYEDFLQTQEQSLALQHLLTQGKTDEAEAQRIIFSLEKSMGAAIAGNTVEAQKKRDAVLATVQAVRAEQRETDIMREKQRKYVEAIGDVKSAIQGAIGGGIDGIKELPGRIVKAFRDFKAKELFDKIFGDAFRELEDQANGTTVVKDASLRMADAIDATLAPLARLAAGANAAASGVATGSISDTADSPPAGSAGDIVVQGKKPRRAVDLFSDITAKLAKGVGISDEAATKIGKFGGKAIEGAATGAFTNSFLAPIGKALGIKTSQTGAQIGGAIGSALPIPGGDIIGSVIGSVVGGLFKKSKTGSATITSVDQDASLSGNSGTLKKAAAGAAKSVQEGIQAIADQLGGTLGSFSVSIGQYKDKGYRVDTTGSGRVKGGVSTVTGFGDDEAGAISFAIADAIKDGAVKGLSSPVQKAISSNSDVNKALSEALKVQALEELIGGIGSTLQKTFKDVETAAADRVRLAKAYGLDLVKVEAANAKQRVDTLDQVLKSRLSSVQSLLDEISFGSLAEGSPADKRNTLLDQITKAQADAVAGVDGAADKLVTLQRSLLDVTKSGFGTAGPEYSGDLASTVAQLERVKAAETDRVKSAAAEAQKLTTAVEAGNSLADETNDLLSKMGVDIAALRDAVASGNGTLIANAISTARYTEL